MMKLGKPYTASAEQILVLEDILLQLADRSQNPHKYGLDPEQLLQNNQALENLNQLMARISRITSN